jgi:hypothetical protein
MANSEKIDEIISPQAFQQLDALLQKLGMAQTAFGVLATSVATVNSSIGKSTSIKELNDSVKVSEKNFVKLEETLARVRVQRTDVTRAEQEAVQVSKSKLVAFEEESKILNGLAGSMDQQVRANLRLKVELQSVREEQKALNRQSTSSTSVNGQLAKSKVALATRENELRQAITASALELRRSTKESQLATGSLEQKAIRLDRLRASYKQLSDEERQNAQVGGVLLESIKRYDEELKKTDATQGVFNRSVADYSNQAQDALQKTGFFSREMAVLKQATGLYDLAMKASTISTASFKAVLISTGIGAIIILIGSLIGFLTRTQEGMDFLGRATEGLTTFLAVLLDGFTLLGKQIAENIMPVLEGLGKVILGLQNVNISQIKEGFQGIKDAVSKIEPVNIIELGATAAKAAEEASRLKGIIQELDKAEADLGVTVAQNKAEFERLREVSNDDTKSFKDRLDASTKAFEIESSNERELIKLKQERLKTTRLQNELTISVEADKQKERDLEKEIAEISGRASKARRKLLKEQESIRKQAETERRKGEKDEEDALKRIDKASFDLENSRLKRAIDRNKGVAQDEKLGLEDRISNLEQYLVNEEKLIKLARDFELSNKDLLEDERVKITENAENEIANLKIEGAEIGMKILQDQLNAQEKATAERVKAEIEGIKKEQAEKLTELNNAFNSGLITEKQFQEQKLSIISTYGRLALEAEIRSIEDIISANKTKGISVIEEERKIAEIKQKLSEETTAKTIDDLKKIEEKEKQLKELQAQLANELFNLGVTLIQQRFEKEEQKLAQEQENVEVRKEDEIAQIEATVLNEEEKQLRLSNAEKRAQLETEKIAEKQRQLKIKQARFDKVLAIANIIRSTAQAIIVQLAGAPFFPISGPLIPIIAGIGAAQIAQVVAQQIPAFAKGTKYSPEGIAWVGEQGSEMRINPDGSEEMTPDKATLTYLQKGTQIIPHKESLKLVESKKDTFDAMIFEQRRSTEVLKKELRRSRGSGVNITREGITMMHEKGKKASLYDSKLL